MSLLDGLAGQVLGSLEGSSGGQGAGLMAAVTNIIATYPGGLGGLLAKFQQSGLGGVAASWVGTGANEPLSPVQVHSAFGGEQLRSMASSAGLSVQDLSAGLSQLLPQVVDHLTPAGTVPDQNTFSGLLGALDRRA